jgi:hypothetical protein
LHWEGRGGEGSGRGALSPSSSQLDPFEAVNIFRNPHNIVHLNGLCDYGRDYKVKQTEKVKGEYKLHELFLLTMELLQLDFTVFGSSSNNICVTWK